MIGGQPNNDPGVDATDMAFPDALGEVLGSDPVAVDMRTAWKVKGRKANSPKAPPGFNSSPTSSARPLMT